MRIVLLCGPPCAGKTSLAHRLATGRDCVLDYDDIARSLGSPDLWNHSEPWRSEAERVMQARITQVHTSRAPGTAWVIRTAPRADQRQRLTTLWQATCYLLNPGERQCVARARADQRPSGTARAIGIWYHRYRPWSGDRDPSELDERWANPAVRVLRVDPSSV